MSTRTSHRRAAGKKSRQEKYLHGEKSQSAKKSRFVRTPDENRGWDEKIVTVFAACEKCFGYALTINGLCWHCENGGAA